MVVVLTVINSITVNTLCMCKSIMQWCGTHPRLPPSPAPSHLPSRSLQIALDTNLNPVFLTAIEMVDDENYIGADGRHIFICQKNRYFMCSTGYSEVYWSGLHFGGRRSPPK